MNEPDHKKSLHDFTGSYSLRELLAMPGGREEIIRRIKQHIWGPVGSVFFHILLFIILINVAAKVSKTEEVNYEITQVDMTPSKNIEKLNEEIKEIATKPEDIPENPNEVPPPDVNALSTSQDNTAPGESAGAGVGFGGSTGFGSAPGDLQGFDVAASTGPLKMSGLYAGRNSGGRGGYGRQYGGRHYAATEAAVNKALEWLKNHQEADGSWGPRRTAMTGLGLLTFLAHGETTGSKKYGATVRKAIEYLSRIQREDGALYSSLNTSGNGGDPGCYEHAIATYALCEAYGLTKIPDLKERMEKALKIIVSGQQGGGLWNYGYLKNDRHDLSVSGWQVQALKAGYINGAEVDGLHESLNKAIAGIKTMQNQESGFFGYSSPNPGGNKFSMTGVGVLCQQLLGAGTNKSVAAGLQALNEASCDWKNPPPWAMYAWYYVTQAKFQANKPSMWNIWNEQFATELPKYQEEDGHWNAPLGKDGTSEETSSGPVYSTTLAALTLQVYYRILPTFKPIKVEEPKEDKKSDVGVEII